MNFLLRFNILLFTVLLTACFNPESAPSTPPENVTVTEGDGLVVVDWDTVPGRKYWIFYKEGTNTSLDEYDRILLGITPPYILRPLSNATQYAFAVTSSQNGSSVGPFSPVYTATPRLLGPSIPWLVGTPLGINDLHSIALGNATYVTVGDAASVFVAAYDYPDTGGVTGWNSATSLPVGASTNLTSVLFDGQRFVILGDDGSILINTDTEALVWSAATAIVSPATMNALAASSTRYVAVGDSGVIYTNANNGATTAWTAQVSGTSEDLYGVSYVNGRFIAVGALGTLLTSTDGITWIAQTSNTNESLRSVAYGASTYVAVGDTGTVVSSTDAITWIAHINPLPSTESFRAICYGPDAQFIAVGTAGMLAYSSTGLDGSWATSNAGSIDLNAIYPNLVFIATGVAGANASGK